MTKKRELTVEVWLRKMTELMAYEESIGYGNYVDRMLDGMAKRGITGDDAVYELVNIMYEHQIASEWKRQGMQVYEFDRDFTESILGEKWVELLPDCIGNRPHDCFYMKLPCGEQNEGVVVNVVPTGNILGFDPSLFPGLESGKGVYIGGDPKSKDGDRGRVAINTGSETFALCSFAISKTFDLMTDDTPVEPYPADLVANGVAYLCSVNADIVPSYIPVPGLRRNNAKRRSQAEWHDVGCRIGADLRAYSRSASRGEHNGGTVRPHMRRAHWHHFWTGPRNGERKLVLRWLSPTMVGSSKPGHATIHRV